MKNRNAVLIAILSALACFALLPKLQADDVVPVSNTADGQNAMLSITTGIHNTAFGFDALLSNSTSNFNTAVGSVALLLTNGDPTVGEGLQNTAVGAGTLLSNTTGSSNTAVGAFALFSNSTGGGHTAVGEGALEHTTASGGLSANTAVGIAALFTDTSGGANTAVGEGALFANDSGSANIGIGPLAGGGVTTHDNIIAIGAGVSGVSSAFGEVDDSCYIGNIFGATIDVGTAVAVGVDGDGKLGTMAVDANGNKVPVSSLIGTQQQAMLNRKVEELQATVAQLTQQLKDQGAQIQKVSAQLEVSKPAPRTVANK
jgi:hypothetical protein